MSVEKTEALVPYSYEGLKPLIEAPLEDNVKALLALNPDQIPFPIRENPGDPDYGAQIRKASGLRTLRSNVFILQSIPSEYLETALRAYINLKEQNLPSRDTMGFEMKDNTHDRILQCFPKAIKFFENTDGGQEMLELFIEIAEAGPRMQDSPINRALPLNEPEKFQNEMRAFLDGAGEFKTEIMAYTKALANPRSSYQITFLKEFNPDKIRTYMPSVNPLESVKKLKAEGYADEKIKEILMLGGDRPWLEEAAHIVVDWYTELNKKFPGGMDAFLKYAERIRSCPVGIRKLAEDTIKEELPENISEYLEIGALAIEKIGSSAFTYFFKGRTAYEYYRTNEYPEYDFMTPHDLLEKDGDPKLLRKIVLESAEFASQFPTGTDYRDNWIRIYCFNFFVNNYNNPRREEIRGAIQTLLGKYKSLSKELLDKHMEEKRSRLLGYRRYHPLTSAVATIFQSTNIYGKTQGDKNEIKMIERLLLNEVDLEGKAYKSYTKMVKQGFNLKLAAAMQITGDKVELVPIEELGKLPIPIEKARRIADEIGGTKRMLKNVNESPTTRLKRRHAYPLIRERAEKMDIPDIDEITAQIARLEELENDPEIAAYINFDKDKTNLEKIKHLAFFKSMMNIGIMPSSRDLQTSSFTKNTNQTTQMAITGLSLLVAIGAHNMKGISDKIEQIPTIPTKRQMMGQTEDESSSLMAYGEKYGQIIKSNIQMVLPHIEAMIRKARQKSVGLMPIGGKVHTVSAMDEKTIEFLTNIFGFNKTPFKLIHAGESLILPPAPTAFELKMLLHILEQFGVVEGRSHDLQVAVAGRWSDENASTVGASILLSTQHGVQYAPEAFKTTDDKRTGARIMTYDAGVKTEGLPYDLPEAIGRTDMLGRHAHSDVYNYQILGTLATHNEWGGRFAERMEEFRGELEKVLDGRGLSDHLHHSPWIHDHAQKWDSPEDHENMVSAFTNAWLEGSGQSGYGVIGEVSRLIAETEMQRMAEREDIIAANRGEYEKLLRY